MIVNSFDKKCFYESPMEVIKIFSWLLTIELSFTCLLKEQDIKNLPSMVIYASMNQDLLP